MKKLCLILFFATLIPTVMAENLKPDYEQHFEINGKFIKVGRFESHKMTLDSSCYQKKQFDCDAFKKLNKASFKGLDEFFKQGQNRGAVVCKHSLKGLLVMGKDKDGNENTFCQFKDNSLVLNTSIWYYANKNDGNFE